MFAGRVGEGLGGRAEKVLEVAIGESEREREREGADGEFSFSFLKREKGWGTLQVKEFEFSSEAVWVAVGERVFK
jgi:hypothetical protein